MFCQVYNYEWNRETRGSAAVHCVIIGMTFAKDGNRSIYEYDHVRGEPHLSEVTRINGYLINGPQYSVPARSKPPEGRLEMHKGSQPTDGARIKKPAGGYLKFSNLILKTATGKSFWQSIRTAKNGYIRMLVEMS